MKIIIDNRELIIPILTFSFGYIAPYLNSYIEKLIHRREYKILKQVYREIDPQIITKIESSVPLLELIHSGVVAVSDRRLSLNEIDKLTKLALKNYQLFTAWRKAH